MKKSTKLFSLLLCVAMCGCAFFFTACGQNNDDSVSAIQYINSFSISSNDDKFYGIHYIEITMQNGNGDTQQVIYFDDIENELAFSDTLIYYRTINTSMNIAETENYTLNIKLAFNWNNYYDFLFCKTLVQFNPNDILNETKKETALSLAGVEINIAYTFSDKK